MSYAGITKEIKIRYEIDTIFNSVVRAAFPDREG